ncbi:MAG TPA: recombinase family protein [Pseudomonadales bacterium]|nr:recombinase family protein [Pseudomonadales bacterium]
MVIYMENNAKVYSYLRFSDPKQAAGHSAERQLAYAATWAGDRGLVLDESLSLRDEGLSAYHQKHVKKGALGVFLQAVDEGRIPVGSVLIVEGLDRLSRAEPILAQAQLAQIINAGITVVTASDGKEYNRESLKATPMDLVYSLLVMIRAHEESDTKSKRVKASIRRQCEKWIAGTNRDLIRNGKDPAWLTWTGKNWALIPERVEAVLYLIDLFRRGYGSVRIVREMASRNMKLTDKGVETQQVYRTIRLRALIGEKTLEVDGEEYRLEGYYPPIMQADEFEDLQRLANERGRRKGKGEIPNIVTGLGITYCGYCGKILLGQNLMSRARKPNGNPQDGHRRVICMGYSHNSGCSVGGSCSVVPIERALMEYCSDKMNLVALLSSDSRSTAVHAKAANAKRRLIELQTQQDKITEALLSDDTGSPPIIFVKKARELEEEIGRQKYHLEQAERELAGLTSALRPTLADEWSQLASGVQNLDYDSRMKVRQLMADTFEKIVVYHRGVQPNNSNNFIDILLISKKGGSRLLRVDRRGGGWIAGEDYENLELVS